MVAEFPCLAPTYFVAPHDVQREGGPVLSLTHSLVMPQTISGRPYSNFICDGLQSAGAGGTATA